jgi:hypothetical protein
MWQIAKVGLGQKRRAPTIHTSPPLQRPERGSIDSCLGPMNSLGSPTPPHLFFPARASVASARAIVQCRGPCSAYAARSGKFAPNPNEKDKIGTQYLRLESCLQSPSTFAAFVLGHVRSSKWRFIDIASTSADCTQEHRMEQERWREPSSRVEAEDVKKCVASGHSDRTEGCVRQGERHKRGMQRDQ